MAWPRLLFCTFCSLYAKTVALGEPVQPACKEGVAEQCATPSSSLLQARTFRQRAEAILKEDVGAKAPAAIKIQADTEKVATADAETHAQTAEELAAVELEESTVEFYKGAQIVVHHASDVAQHGGGTWVIMVPEGCTTADLNAMAQHMPPGSTPEFQGDPDAGGLSVFMMKGTHAQVMKELDTHTWPSTPVVETDTSWGIIPEIGRKDDADGYPGLVEMDSSFQQSNPPSWGLDRIDDRSGLDQDYSPPQSGGAGVHVFVADTGIRTTHSDFGGRAIPALEVLSSTRNVCDPKDTTCAADGQGHGTHCAGTIGGQTYGVAKSATLHAVKVLSDSGTGSFSWFIEALDWVMVSGARPSVFSASLGGYGTYSSVSTAINSAVAAGVTVVVAAGNSGSSSVPDACQYSPAFVPSAITVGATDTSDRRASYSSYGSCLDIFAPGSGIKSAGHRSDTGSTTMSGTSMACPHVAGASALILAEDPTRSPLDVLTIMHARATGGAVQDAKPGSPNLLLYTGSDTAVPTPAPLPTPVPTPNPTPAPQPVQASGSCSFETSGGDCSVWYNAVGDQFDWTVWSGSTPSSGTGPDSAADQIKYMYIETSTPRQQGDQAVLKSLPLIISGPTALDFEYHMKGSGVGSLEVKVGSAVVWQQSGPQGDQWLHPLDLADDDGAEEDETPDGESFHPAAEGVGRKEIETDAPEDSRPRLKEPVVFLTPDTTLNVLQAEEGSLLMTLNEGGLQYLLAGARASVGVKAGRYMFEAKIIENLNQIEVTGSQVRTPVPRNLLRIGFSLAGGQPILGDSEDGICFDSEGNLLFNRKRSPVSQKFAADDTVAVVLNLYPEGSPNASTISLFKDGERVCAPQPLPENLQGQVLYPTLTFRNVTVHVNFGPTAYVPLPFTCRMLQDAAGEDTAVTHYPEPEDGRYEVMFPVMLPDEGTFDWLEWFIKKNPRYCELSERMIVSWALRSGLWRPKTHTYRTSNDKPDMNFGIPHLDDGSVKQVLIMAATAQQRDIVIMEVKGNLTKEERREWLQRFRLPHFKRVARVMVGEPEEGYKEYVQNCILAEKQAKSDADFQSRKQEKARKKLIELRQKEVERARKKAERIKKRMEDAQLRRLEAQAAGEEVPPEAEDPEAEEGKDGEDEADEEPQKEESEGEEQQPPKAALSSAESREWFRKPGVLTDISTFVLSQTYHRFGLPEDGEGFDEIRYCWQDHDGCMEHLRRWNVERKMATRIDDLQPSDWFREKWQEWQRDLQHWHMKHMEFKDPNKRAALIAAAAKVALKEEMQQEAQKNGVKKEEKDTKEEKDEKEVKEEGKEGSNDAKKEAGEEPEKTGDDENTPPDNKSKEEEQEVKKEEKDEIEEEEDLMKALEDEMDRSELDIFGVDSITDIGTGEPLFADFAFEDWALLSLRFELHLLVHAFRRDCNDEERTGIHPEHLAFYYNKYFKKGLNPANYGVNSIEDLIILIQDTVIVCMKAVESQLIPDLETNEIFVRLTEEGRRDRQRRLDSGDEGAILKFQSRPAEQSLATMGGKGGKPPMRPSLTGMQVGKNRPRGERPPPMRMQAPPAPGQPYNNQPRPGGQQWAPRYGGLKGSSPQGGHRKGYGGRGSPYQQQGWRYGAPQPGGQVGAPVGQTGAPAGQVGAPMGQVGAPMGQYGAPMGQPGAPMGQPGAPMGQPGAPMGQPGAPMGQPGAPMGQPGAPWGQSGAPMGQPGAPGQLGPPMGQMGSPVGVQYGGPVSSSPGMPGPPPLGVHPPPPLGSQFQGSGGGQMPGSIPAPGTGPLQGGFPSPGAGQPQGGFPSSGTGPQPGGFPGQFTGQAPSQMPGQFPGQFGQMPGQAPGSMPGQVPGQFSGHVAGQ